MNSMVKKTLLAIRNGVVVFGIIAANDVIVSHQIIQDHLIVALAMSVLWTGYELQRVYKFKLNGGINIVEGNKNPFLFL